MSIIKACGKTYNGLKSTYLNDVLKLRDRNGNRFMRNLRVSTVKTSCGHTLWFTEVNGTWNRFFREDGIDYIRENNLNGKWNDPADRAAEKFAAGIKAVRSAICRWHKSDANRYFGEYQLIEINDEFRIWKRIADEVEMETCA